MGTANRCLQNKALCFAGRSEIRIYIIDHLYKLTKIYLTSKLYNNSLFGIMLSAMEDNEKEAAVYIGGIVVLIAVIIILVSLTHVVLTP